MFSNFLNLKFLLLFEISLILLPDVKSENIVFIDEKLGNSFDLTNKSIDKSQDGIVPEDDDDNNSFFSIKSSESKVYAKEVYEADLELHYKFVKMFIDKIQNSKTVLNEFKSKKYPVDVNFTIKFNEDIIKALKKNVKNSKEANLIEINEYFIKSLTMGKVQNINIKEIKIYTKWYQSKYFLFSFLIVVITSFVFLSKTRFILILILLAIFHKGFELYEAEEKKKLSISLTIPNRCLTTVNETFWGRIWSKKSNSIDCAEFYKHLNRDAHFSVNLVKIFIGLMKDCLVGLSDAFSKAITIYHRNLSQYLPWYLTPIFMFILLVTPFVFVMLITTNLFTTWLKHGKSVSNQNYQYHKSINRPPQRNRPRFKVLSNPRRSSISQPRKLTYK